MLFTSLDQYKLDINELQGEMCYISKNFIPNSQSGFCLNKIAGKQL